MEKIISQVIGFLVPLVELAGVFVVMLGVVRTMVFYLRRVRGRHKEIPFSLLRETLGRNMIMGLEFQVAADILKTGLTPTWNELLLLAGLITVRTVLNFLLEHELRAASSFQSGDKGTPGGDTS